MYQILPTHLTHQIDPIVSLKLLSWQTAWHFSCFDEQGTHWRRSHSSCTYSQCRSLDYF